MSSAPLHPLELPRRMAPSDAIFWFVEEAVPEFRPLIAGLYVLGGRPDAGRVLRGVEAACDLVPRLRQRVVEAPYGLGLPEYADDPHFDRDYHLRHLSLPAPGTPRQLLDLAAAVFATPLDRERPLWEMYWIEGLEGGRTALFHKMHHALVDGVGSLAIMHALTQREREDPVPRVRALAPREAAPDALGRVRALVADNVRAGARGLVQAVTSPLRVAAHPLESLESVGATLRGLRGMAADLARPAVRDPLAENSTGLSRRLDIAQVPLERLRKIKAPLGVTINDVVLTALAGTLGAYHRERGVEVETLNCMVPMNLRGKDEKDVMGNRVGAFNIALPVGVKQVKHRLEVIARQTRAAKRDQRGAAMPLLLQGLQAVPAGAFRWLARNSLGRVNVVCTNVPGVNDRRFLAGAEIEAIYPFASPVMGTPLVFALLSYAGTLDIGIDTDPEAIPDPHRIADLYEGGLQELEWLADHSVHHPSGAAA